MKWKGKEIKTIRDARKAISEIDTKEEANRFLKKSKEETAYAEENIDYIIGYFNKKKRNKLYSLFDLNHLILNENWRDNR